MNTTQQPHTPTPWRSINGAIFDTAYSSNHIRKALAICGDINAADKESENEKAKANAEFIVRAVNSHEALLLAAKDALEVVANWYDNGQRDDVTRLLIVKLTKAIAKAGGK